MPDQGREWISEINLVLSDKKYAALSAILSIAFSVVFVFAWNLILLNNLYVRADLWTPENILFLLVISALSGLAVTLGAYGLKARIPYYEGKYGYLAMIPAIFASACPSCAPLILSFTSASFAIGMSLAKYNIEMRLASIALLSATILYLSKSIGTCKVSPRK